MPSFNRYLQTPLYVGEGSGDGSLISLNKVPFFGPSCSTGGWYNKDYLACQYYNENQHPIFILINKDTKARILLLNEGAMGIVTGGERWFAQTLSQYLLDGVPSEKHAYCFGLDGTLVWHPFSGLGLYIEDDQITPNQVNDVSYLEDEQVVYMEYGKIKSNILGAENIVSLGNPGEFGNLRAYWWDGNLWVMYQWYNANSIVTHPYDNFNGYLLGSGNCFGPDANVYDGKPVFIWSVSPAFQAEHIMEVNKLGELFDLRTLLSAPPIIPPVEPPIEPPIEPPVEPPEPPVPGPEPEPEKPIKEIEELELMDPETVSLVAFDHYARVLDGRVVFDRTEESKETNFEMSKPDDRFAIKKDGKFVGVDSTVFSPDIRDQYYMTDSRGNYESFFVGTTPNGLIVCFVEYIQQGANNTIPFISVPVTIKRHV